MPSCQVLLNSKNGELAAQISTTATAAKKVIGFPAIRAISEANDPNISCTERASRASNTCALSPGSAFLPFTCTLDFAFFIMFILPQLTSYAGGSYFEKRLWGDDRGIAFEKMYCAGGVGRILPNGTESGGCGAMEEFEEIFEDLEDPRTGNAKRHELHEILVIGFCTLLSGGETCADMALFGRSKLEFLQEFLRLEHGVPSHDTFSRVFRLLDPDRFHAWFIGLMRGFAETCQGVVAIDGKTLRRSFDRAAAASPLHLVSAWAVDQRLVLGQLAVGDKSNEIVAVPKLLELLSLKGRIITAD